MSKRVAPSSIRWIHEERVDSTLRFRVGKRGSKMVADWPGFARLTCAHDGTGATLAPAPGASRRDVGKLRRGQARALLWDLAGKLALHASAVAIDGHAVLFLGADGAGKSTAAAEMCLAHNAQMLSDDAASLDVTATGVYVVPCEKDHWLTHQSQMALGITGRRDSPNGKKRCVRAKTLARDPVPLDLILALRFSPVLRGPVARRLPGGDAAHLLLNAVARFDVEDIRARHREFEQVTTVFRSAPFVELVRPGEFPGGVAPFVLEMLGKRKQ